MKVSLDGGDTFVEAPHGVRVIYENVYMPGEDVQGEVHINCTHEGIITDVWTEVGNHMAGENIGTQCETVDELVERLVEDNRMGATWVRSPYECWATY